MSEKIKTKAGIRKTKTNLLSPRNLLFLFAAFTFTVSTYLAFTQAPFPTPFKAKVFLSKDWWQYPIEQNAFTRLPVITSSISDVFVLPDGKNIWIVGDNGLILHSSDGGKNWQQQSIGAATATQSIDQKQTSDNSSWSFFKQAHAADKIDKTKTQAKTLAKNNEQKRPTRSTIKKRQLDKLKKDSKKPTASSNSNLSPTPPAPPTPALEESNSKLKSSNTPDPSTNLNAVHFSDALNGWVVGDRGTILHTVDGGNSWATQTSGSSRSLNSVQFLDKGLRGWAVGNGTILHTADGGKSWAAQTSGASSWLTSVQFLDKGLRGWTVGNGGTILHTADGGKSWAAQTSGASSWLTSVQFLDKGLRGWAVGDEGTILHTVDGGKSWAAQTSESSSNLESVQFLDKGLRGWAVGREGTILHTVDGGKSWAAQTSGSSSRLRSVQFLDKGLRGWVV
ncbi:hypothetical protein MNBD_GAMMA08-272, partial [hydrothermal vent metagenome]